MTLTEPTLAPPLAPSTVDMAQIFAAHAERIGRTSHDNRHEDEFQDDRQQRQRPRLQRIGKLQTGTDHDEAEAE